MAFGVTTAAGTVTPRQWRQDWVDPDHRDAHRQT
jgi:hypothetical protein